MTPARENDDAELFDFVDEYHRDAGAGRTLGLAHYLKRFPGHEEAISREFLRLRRVALDDVATPAVAEPRDEKRIGPYKLIRELGQGGQGAVWLAEDTRIARRVALKFLPHSFALLSADRRRRFQREAEVVSRLEHPSICPVYEAQIEHDPPYIAMRLVEGETLAAAITRGRKGEAPPEAQAADRLPLPPRTSVDVRRVIAFFERAARALHAAHEAGVIHRDIKPGNVMVTKTGEPIVLDFGQARDERAGLGEQTLSGEVFGTPAYMSPEQVLGSAHALDRRTDVWSLGASLYEALTLARPFEGDSVAALLHAIRTRPLVDPRTKNSAIDDDLAVVVETALEKDVARRYATALEFAEDLRRIREYEPIRARPASAALKLRRWARRHPALATSIGGVIVTLIAGLAGTLYMLKREREVVVQKDAALDHAVGRHMAERAVDLLDEDPAASLAIGLRANELGPSYQTRAALLAALDACYLSALFNGDPVQFALDMDAADDSRRAVIALDDQSVRVWDLRAGAQLADIRGFPGPVKCVRALPGGERFVAASTDRLLRVQTCASGALVASLDAPGADVVALEVDPSGRSFAALARDGSVAVYDVPNYAQRCTMKLEPERFGRAQFSSDGELLLFSTSRYDAGAALHSDEARLHSARDGRALGTLAPGAVITWAELSPNGERAVTTTKTGSVTVWRVPACERDGDALELGVSVVCARFTRDSSALVLGTEAKDGRGVLVWDLATRTTRTLDFEARGRVLSIDVSPRDRIVATSSDMQVTTWERDGRKLASFRAWMPPLETRWTRDGERLFTPSRTSFVQVWWGENRPDVYALRGHTSAVTSACFNFDGSRALTVSKDGTARLWHTPRGANERGEHEPGTQLAVFGDANAAVTTALFSKDGARVVTLASDGTVATWSANDGAAQGSARVRATPLSAELDPAGARIALVDQDGRALVRALDGTSAVDIATQATRARWMPDGSALAVGGADSALRIVDASNGALLLESKWEPKNSGAPGVADLDVRSDGRQVVVAGRDGRVRFIALADEGEARSDIVVFPMRSIAYDPAGKRVLAIGLVGPGAMRIQSLDIDKPVKLEFFHSGYITSGVFDARGERVVTSSEDMTAIVREASTGEPLARLAGHTAAVLSARFSVDDGPLRIITASADGTARIWPLDPVAAALERQPRALRDDEIAREKRLALPLPYH